MKVTALACLILIAFCLGLSPAKAQEQTPPTGWEIDRDAAHKAFVQGDLDEAERKWKSALTAAEQTNHIEPGLVTCLVGLAYVYDKKGNPGEAERVYELAMRNLEGLVGPKDPRFADWMPGLATLYDEHGRPDKAEFLFKKALTIKRNAYGNQDVRVAAVMESYAKFLHKNGRNVEASDLEQIARTIRSKVTPN